MTSGKRRETVEGLYSQPSTQFRPIASWGFTLIELLVVIAIILLASAVALPTIKPGLSHRQVREAARMLQAALLGARDKAIQTGQPCGIRLLPDQAYPINWTPSGTINPCTILAYNRWVTVESAPDYREGRCISVPPNAVVAGMGWPVPISPRISLSWQHGALPPALILVESPANPANGAPNAPTSWFWNIRIGDKIQLNGAGPWYTIVGPMAIGPGQGNTEMFVNAGLPAPPDRLPVPRINGTPVEYLALVNGQDDNRNGWTDEGFDGVDNNGDGLIDDNTEWELEDWHGATASQPAVDVSYTIKRRPAPVANGREVFLPTSVVIDATTSFLTRERSRLPVNRYTGDVDILLKPDGTVLPNVVYGTPSSFGMTDAFYHFWLAERVDLTDASTQATVAALPPLLPVSGNGQASALQYRGPKLQGNYGLVTVYTRTGEILTNEDMPFDDPVVSSTAHRPFDVNVPFSASQTGAAGS